LAFLKLSHVYRLMDTFFQLHLGTRSKLLGDEELPTIISFITTLNNAFVFSELCAVLTFACSVFLQCTSPDLLTFNNGLQSLQSGFESHALCQTAKWIEPNVILRRG
jgi:hypothetical protein